ncbi:MAG: hypothetical protein KC656_08040 [Myxococcales bacterium]|nr:hypothetical protein [Myxococcales bacterium]
MTRRELSHYLHLSAILLLVVLPGCVASAACTCKDGQYCSIVEDDGSFGGAVASCSWLPDPDITTCDEMYALELPFPFHCRRRYDGVLIVRRGGS